jgi:hypothetical protein
MASRRRFRPRPRSGEATGDRGTKRGRPCGSAVQGGRTSGPRAEHEAAGRPKAESRGVDTREKPVGEGRGRPYRKPTQVGEASSLRWTSETGSRNSAY